MERRALGSLALVTAVPLVIGLTVTASSLLVRYPFATGQALRYAAATAVFAVLVCRAGGPGPLARLGVGDWLLLGGLAATSLVGFNLSVLGSLSRIDPSLTGTIVGCAPIALAIAAPALQRRWPRPARVAAAVVVAAGAALVQAASSRSSALGLLLALGALAGEVLFSLLAVPLLPKLGPLRLSLALAGLATAMLAALAPVVDRGAPIRSPSEVEAGALAFQGLFVTVFGFVGWYTGIQRLGAERAGLFTGLIPISTLVGSVLAGTSALTWGKAAGVLVVAAGLAVGMRGRRPEPGAGPSPYGAGCADECIEV